MPHALSFAADPDNYSRGLDDLPYQLFRTAITGAPDQPGQGLSRRRVIRAREHHPFEGSVVPDSRLIRSLSYHRRRERRAADGVPNGQTGDKGRSSDRPRAL